MKTPDSLYSRTVIAAIRAKALREIPLAKSVSHIYPRAYCLAKPAPCCAVFATPWFDSEPQIRQKQFSAYEIVHQGVAKVKAGDWCSIAYVSTPGCGQLWVIENHDSIHDSKTPLRPRREE